MCYRRKEPYKGLYNLVGGKIEEGENGFDAACRELFEETGITSADIELHHLMDFKYYDPDILLECYAGILKHEVTPYGEENELCWIDADSNFFDMTVFAGRGNIGHMLEQVKLNEDIFL